MVVSVSRASTCGWSELPAAFGSISLRAFRSRIQAMSESIELLLRNRTVVLNLFHRQHEGRRPMREEVLDRPDHISRALTWVKRDLAGDVPLRHRCDSAPGSPRLGADPIRQPNKITRDLNAQSDLSTLAATPGGDAVVSRSRSSKSRSARKLTSSSRNVPAVGSAAERLSSQLSSVCSAVAHVVLEPRELSGDARPLRQLAAWSPRAGRRPVQRDVMAERLAKLFELRDVVAHRGGHEFERGFPCAAARISSARAARTRGE